MKSLIQRYPIGGFLVINYLISWSFLYPSYQMILQNDGEITPLALIGFIGAYGPTIAAIIVQRIIARDQLKALFKKLIQLKVGYRTYLLLLVPILCYAVVYALAVLSSKQDMGMAPLAALSGLPVWLLLALPFGPMGEELGWRGFMLPRLLEKYSAVKSSVLIGLAWGVWHLASFTFPGAAIPSFYEVNALTIGLYLMNTIGLSLFFTYVHLKGKGSVFIAILLHAAFNAAANVAADLVPGIENQSIESMAYISNFVVVGLLGWVLIKRLKHDQTD